MNLTFDAPQPCGWCLVRPATTIKYATPSCLQCAASSAKDRVNAWSRAVYARTTGRQGT